MSGAKHRVLIIDDSEADRKVYRRFLERGLGVEVLDAPTGEDGLRLCRSHEPDCIIVDFKLPDMDGFKVIEGLSKFCSIPIIFVTAHPAPLMQTQAYRQGVVKFLSKDLLSSDSLQAAVAEAMGKSASERT